MNEQDFELGARFMYRGQVYQVIELWTPADGFPTQVATSPEWPHSEDGTFTVTSDAAKEAL